MPEIRVAVLASHKGSNLRALHRASLADDSRFCIALVISNNSGSGALAFAREHGIPALHMSGRTYANPDDLDEAMRVALREHRIDWVVTAGYMKKVGDRTRREYASRILNIHPALLPRHGGPGMFGQAVHAAVLASGDQFSGPSVHLVTQEYDAGEVIAQSYVPVLAEDTVETLAQRVLAAEHALLPAVIRKIAHKEIL
ncbi:phosphoribosylglycinamide formyltransferase [Nocardia sp. NPDC003482]